MLPLLIAADHAGWQRKETLKKKLTALGVPTHDLTPTFKAGDDYPLVAKKLAQRVSAVADARGILVCGSGVGMAIAANRVKRVRAVEGFSPAQMKLARKHNDVNVLTLGAWHVTVAKEMPIINAFLNTKTSNATRHHRRVKQLG